jgi:ATP-binding cassette, subfamily C (CFTR/MRP), member 1
MTQHKTYRTLTMIRAGLVSLIYKHTLFLNSTSVSESASLTLINADVERVGQGMRNMHEIWASFFEIGLSLWLLEMQIGVATAAAVGVVIGMV